VDRPIDLDTDKWNLEPRLELMQIVLHSMGHSVQDLAATVARTKTALSREIDDTRKVDNILLDLDHVSRSLLGDFDTMRNLLRWHPEATEASLSEVVENTIELFQGIAARSRLTITMRSTGDGICAREPLQAALTSLMHTLLRLNARRSGNEVLITIARTSQQFVLVKIQHPFEGLATYLERSDGARRDEHIELDMQMAKHLIASIDGNLEVIDAPQRSSLVITVPSRGAVR
jgi:hypothetical protein